MLEDDDYEISNYESQREPTPYQNYLSRTQNQNQQGSNFNQKRFGRTRREKDPI
jgi:hypothetical protein